MDFDRDVVTATNVPEAGEYTKSRKIRAVPMTEAVKSVLAALHAKVPKVLDRGMYLPRHPHCFSWPDGRQFKTAWVGRRFGALVEAAGIPHCTIHDLRRSFSTLAQRGHR